MNGLNTMEHLHDKHEMNVYTDKHPPVLIDPEDIEGSVRRAPDYSGVDMELFTKCTNLREIDTFFVDSSGFGRDDESAMSFQSFLTILRETILREVIRHNESTDIYAILSGVGQFQVYVTLLKRG